MDEIHPRTEAERTLRQQRLRNLLIALHWLTLALIAAVYLCMELRGYFPKGSAVREGMKTWHTMLGLSVLMLTLVRVGLRAGNPMPLIVPRPPPWQRLSARLVHGLLYAWLLVMPLLGWLLLSAEGKPIVFFGASLPPLVSESARVAGWAGDLHESIATFGYLLIGLHAAAALFHHYIMRDDTLRRMLVQQKPQSPQ